MESRDDFRSIQPFLPLILRSSSVAWPPLLSESLESLSRGPAHSNVNSGQLFARAVADLRDSLEIGSLHPDAFSGFSLFFDDLMSKDEAEKWFGEVVPRLADLLLRLPALLETRYENAGMETGLRLLESQHSGIVFLSQELIAALLVCALFCLFPTTERGAKHLRFINFDFLFVGLYERKEVAQEHKIRCLLHYFEKICSDMPSGNVSFERKVLPLKNTTSFLVYPEPDFWSKSTVPLCPFQVHTSGLIEDQPTEALEVDFANKSIGGGVLRRGCVQEEIRFVINPELIISILFLPSMADNEAIEIVGAQRFSNYTGYLKSFRFSGEHVDGKSVDSMGRRRTRIIAMDALPRPGKRQYSLECLLRETNKAFCGFFDQRKREEYRVLFEGNGSKNTEDPSSSSSIEAEREGEIGVATGNWGCGAFGGDPEVKTVIQWVAASQGLRPFVLYYTFGLEPLEKLERVVEWIQLQGWSVGEVWDKLVEYSSLRLKNHKETKIGFFGWLLHFDNQTVLNAQP